MELNFQKVQNKWVAEFQLDAAAAIHIEGVAEEDISIYQRSGDSSKYAFVKDTRTTPTCGTVIDYDLSALIYPKFIKVVCLTEPTYAAIISDGEVTEIKAQSKVVEVTANGTTNVAPDAGFAYLSNVEVKTNVPQSGEGGGSASSWRYFAVSGFTEASDLAPFGVMMMKLYAGDVKLVVSASHAALLGQEINACVAYGVDMSAKTNLFNRNAFITWGEGYQGIPPETFEQYGIVEITESEFYNLNA